VPIGFSQEETEEAILAQRLADMGEFSLNTHRTFGDYSGEQAVQGSSTGMQHSMPSSSGLNSGITTAPYIDDLYGSVRPHNRSSTASGMVSNITLSHDSRQKRRNRKEKEPAEVPLSERYPYKRRYHCLI
jgi:hypothetical protein